jgi:uncharacterized NAD(P)/FAD-binding protein YdhS
MSMPARVAIVGGGFSGAVTALQLARKATGPIVIEVIEPRDMLGGGVAYSARDPSHRINVPAARMTVFSDDPTHFDRWLRTEPAFADDPAALWHDGSAYPQRGVFGRYVAGLVEAAQTRPGVAIHHHRSLATEILPRRAGYSLRLANGEVVEADIVVLAVSHPPPAVPERLRAAQAAGAPIVADPWRDGALDGIAADARVLVVGTGLTMADVVASLERREHRGRILAVSRRGLLSRGHAAGVVEKRGWFETSPPSRTALGLARAVRAQVRVAAAEGQPWQAVFDDIRANASRHWGALGQAERRRLVRHLRPFWDVHRFRVAPQLEAAIERLRESGRFEAVAASLLDAPWDGQALQVTLKPRYSAPGTTRCVVADAVVITTGPAHGAVIGGNPALASLAQTGLVRADRIGLGLEVDSQNRAVGVDGTVRADLLVVGPLARGTVGELMGLPQVSEHAEIVAGAVAAMVDRQGDVFAFPEHA